MKRVEPDERPARLRGLSQGSAQVNYRSSVEPDFEAPSSFNQRVKLFRESARLRNASVPDGNDSSAADKDRADSDRGTTFRVIGGDR